MKEIMVERQHHMVEELALEHGDSRGLRGQDFAVAR
jgi:hypothetical protein